MPKQTATPNRPKALLVRLTEDEHRAAAALAQAEDRSLGATVRILLAQAAKQHGLSAK